MAEWLRCSANHGSVEGGGSNPSNAMDVISLLFLRASKILPTLCMLFDLYCSTGPMLSCVRNGLSYTSLLDIVKWIPNFANTVGENGGS